MQDLASSNPLTRLGVSTACILSMPAAEAHAVLKAAYRQLQSFVHPDRVAAEAGSAEKAHVHSSSSALSPEALSTLGEVLKDTQLFELLYADLFKRTPIMQEISRTRRDLRRAQQNAQAHLDVLNDTLSTAPSDTVRALKNCTLTLLDVNKGLNQGAGISLYNFMLAVGDSTEKRAAQDARRKLKFTLSVQDANTFSTERGPHQWRTPSKDSILIGALHTSDIGRLFDLVGLSEPVPQSVRPQSDPRYMGPEHTTDRRYKVTQLTPEEFSRVSSFFSPHLQVIGDHRPYLVACSVTDRVSAALRFHIVGEVVDQKEGA